MEMALKACILEPAQTPALAGFCQSISSSLGALNQKVEAVGNACIIAVRFRNKLAIYSSCPVDGECKSGSGGKKLVS